MGHALPGGWYQAENCRGLYWDMFCLTSSPVNWRRWHLTVIKFIGGTKVWGTQQLCWSKGKPFKITLTGWASRNLMEFKKNKYKPLPLGKKQHRGDLIAFHRFQRRWRDKEGADLFWSLGSSNRMCGNGSKLQHGRLRQYYVTLLYWNKSQTLEHSS